MTTYIIKPLDWQPETQMKHCDFKAITEFGEFRAYKTATNATWVFWIDNEWGGSQTTISMDMCKRSAEEWWKNKLLKCLIEK